jgi:hypothetical protein
MFPRLIHGLRADSRRARSLFPLIALLDIGRFHWSDTVPRALQVAPLPVAAGSMAWTFWAVAINGSLSRVIRTRTERGHHVGAALVRGPCRS